MIYCNPDLDRPTFLIEWLNDQREFYVMGIALQLTGSDRENIQRLRKVCREVLRRITRIEDCQPRQRTKRILPPSAASLFAIAAMKTW